MSCVLCFDSSLFFVRFVFGSLSNLSTLLPHGYKLTIATGLVNEISQNAVVGEGKIYDAWNTKNLCGFV